MWSALVAGSLIAVILVTAVGIAGAIVERAMGARPA
jgi:NitT/TauT family transport system permease protein